MIEEQLKPSELTWLGQRAVKTTGSLQSAIKRFPEFYREPFGPNEYLDVIVRAPIDEDLRHIPVGTVSRRYALVQHAQVSSWLISAVSEIGFDAERLPAELFLSEYGERMRLCVRIPTINVDPGDGHDIALTVECQNSVDRSCALELRVTWRRLVCSNGLWVPEEDRLRKVHHLDWMNSKDAAEFLKERIQNSTGIRDVLQVWSRMPLTIKEIESWADHTLTKAWGPNAAARLCHIARTGFDGAVGRDTKSPPHARFVSSDTKVPGACAPINSVYHLTQALSWIAGQRSAMEEQLARLDQIPRLVAPLLTGNPS